MASDENATTIVAPAQFDEELTTFGKIKAFLESNKPIIGSLGFLIAIVLIVFFSFTSCHVNRVDNRQKDLIKDVVVLAECVDPLTASVKEMTEKYQTLDGILTGIQDTNVSVVESLDEIKKTNGKNVEAVKTELTARIVKLEKDMAGIKSSVATVKATIRGNGLETAVQDDIVIEKSVETTPAVAVQEEASFNETVGNVEIQGEEIIGSIEPLEKKMGFFRRLLPWNWSFFESKPLELNWDNKQGDLE